MLAAIGVGSIEELFEQIPEGVRLGRPLDLEDGLSESEVYARLSALAEFNESAETAPSFLGAGMYDHYVPAIVDAIIGRSEFLTPYTPYQPEVSQGGLQVMFEFQTAMSELTGLPVSNAGLYEGPSAAASAAYVAMSVTGRTGLAAMVIPLAWIVWVMVRGSITSTYPYGFVNVAEYGVGPVAGTLAGILAFGLLVMAIYWGVDAALRRWLGQRAGATQIS